MTDEEKERLIAYRISKAKETVQEINILIENELWNTAVNRLYYACYYAVIALLVKYDLQAQTHAGVRKMFGLHFVKSGIISKELGKFYTEIFDLRQTGDYDDYIDFSRTDVLDLLDPAILFIHEVENLLSK